ncbi:MAG: protein kinase, partial [Nannocystaceae bacterium]
TPAYMSPEQWRGLVVDARSDQFNFCVALWEALVGVHPFDRSSTVALANAVTAGAVIEPPPGRVPRGLLRVVRRGLSQEPERRWPSMDALLDALVAASKRRRWPLVAGAAAGLLAIAWLAQPPAGPREPEDACVGADARMAAAWTDARRADIGRAFAAIGRDFADDAWQRVSPELDAYARAWSAAALDACHAHAPGETELDAHLDASLAARDACLGEALHRFDALVERLRHAPVDSVVRATDAVAALPPLARCVETDAAPGSAHAVTLDPNRDELQQHLAELVTALAAGDDEAARRTATRLQPAVAGVRDPALRIAITRALAELESHTRGPLEASRTLDAAATEALTLGLDAAFLDVTADLVAQLVLIGSSLDVAQTWWTVAEATARRSDADAASEVPLLRAGTLLALTRHQLARAHALASRGRDRARAELGDANVLTLACEGDLARVAMLRRDYDEALATYASLLARARDTYGPLHPRTLELRTFELQARTEAGRSEEALARALALPADFARTRRRWHRAAVAAAHPGQRSARQRPLARRGRDLHHRARAAHHGIRPRLPLVGRVGRDRVGPAAGRRSRGRLAQRPAQRDRGPGLAGRRQRRRCGAAGHRAGRRRSHRRRHRHPDDAARRLAEIERLFAAREPDDDAPAVAAVVAAELALARGDATAARDHAAAAQAWLEQHEFGTSDAGIEAAVVRAHAERVLGDDAAPPRRARGRHGHRRPARRRWRYGPQPRARARGRVATDVAAAEAALAVGEQRSRGTTTGSRRSSRSSSWHGSPSRRRAIPRREAQRTLDALACRQYADAARAERGWFRRGAAR